MSTATVATQPDLTLKKLQLIVQQQEGIFGPLTQISAGDGNNVLEFEVGARPRVRAILKALGKGQDEPAPKPGFVLVCVGECYISGTKIGVAALRARKKVIRDHRLDIVHGSVPGFIASGNAGGALKPEFLVMHYTAGASASSSIDWLCNPASKASAHLVIGRDGSVTQLVPFNRQAWHAGKSRWQGRSSLNRFSIGMELDNAGVLNGSRGKWRTAWGTAIRDEDVLELPHKFDGIVRGWHAFTPVQLEVAREVAAMIVAEYGLLDVIGHDDIAPGRKSDPGPAFPMTSFRAAVLGQ